jgi:Caspase domain
MNKQKLAIYSVVLSATALWATQSTPLWAQNAPGGRNLAVSAAPVQQSAGRRVALVIGNGAYKDAPLGNPVNDARAIAQALQASGFTVIVRENASQKALLGALREFGDRLRGGGVGLFYYAGHGMQIKGRNYLIPVDATIEREDEVAYAAVDAQAVLDKMEAAGSPTNIMILDACRNNPFTRSFRSSSAGLAPMDAPVGTLVAFATSPGAVASDGAGQNGLYTQHLLTAMRQPGAKLEDVFKQVRVNVRRDSQGKQIPWEATSLEGDFYFTATPNPAPTPTAAVPPSPAPQTDVERRTDELLAELARPTAAGKVPPSAVPIATSSPKPPATNQASVVTNPLGIVAGDRWRYQVVDKYKNEVVRNHDWKVDRVLPGGELRLNGGNMRHTADNNLKDYQNATWTQRGSDSHFHYLPSVYRVGHKESFQFKENAQGKDGTVWVQEWEGTLEVKAKERVRVPAGEFDAWRIERVASFKGTRTAGPGRPSWFGRHTSTIWVAPEVRNFVARDEDSRDGSSTVSERSRMELTSYEQGARPSQVPAKH